MVSFICVCPSALDPGALAATDYSRPTADADRLLTCSAQMPRESESGNNRTFPRTSR